MPKYSPLCFLDEITPPLHLFGCQSEPSVNGIDLMFPNHTNDFVLISFPTSIQFIFKWMEIGFARV